MQPTPRSSLGKRAVSKGAEGILLFETGFLTFTRGSEERYRVPRNGRIPKARLTKYSHVLDAWIY